LPSKAAALLYRLSKSQACPEGNKRVALILVNEFLALNGAALALEDDELADMILEAADSEARDWENVVDALTEQLQEMIVPLLVEDDEPEAS
jgi:death-on-curing family protein